MHKSSKSFLYVDIEDALTIHQALIAQAGTKASVRDFSLLHSAIERPKATYNSVDLYPTVFLKAAALMQSVCLNHPFTDGNKRCSWLITKRFLHLNGYHLVSNRKEAGDFMVFVDNGKPPIVAIATFLKKHSLTRT